RSLLVAHLTGPCRQAADRRQHRGPHTVAMNQPSREHGVTALLDAWSHGDADARDRLMPLVYDARKRRAAAFIRRERSGQTLQPTALVHEVYLRLVGQQRAQWRNRA